MNPTDTSDNIMVIKPDPLRDTKSSTEAPPPVKEVIKQTTTSSPSPKLAKQVWTIFVILLLGAFIIALYLTLGAGSRFN